MKIIDLLNKIANDEELPKKIKTGNREYLYDNYNKWYFFGKTNEDMFINKDRLNDEVEIIEEDKESNKIEKVDLKYDDIIYHDDVFFKKEILMYCDNLQEKINEIINKLNERDEDV